MLFFILQCAYLMLPAYFSNMAPIIVRKVPVLNYPVDFGKKIAGIRIFGDHKTYRGLVFGTLFGMITAYLQFILYSYPFFSALSFFDYSNWLLFGFLMGSGAVLGDVIKSFFKRRAGIKPGERFIVWDQLDYVVGALLVVSFIFELNAKLILTVVIMSFFLHIIITHIGYYFGIREVKW